MVEPCCRVSLFIRHIYIHFILSCIIRYQAIDRAHRLGQFKTIKAVRFVIENSIEDRILALQEKKRLIFEGTIGGDNESLSKLTAEDLRFLFQNS
jgi:DNA repair protein RAD16